MKYQPSLALVFGYVLNIDRIPKIASNHHLYRRFSMALDAHNPELGEMHFDVGMFENIFKELLAHMEFDSVEIAYVEGDKYAFKSFEEMLKNLQEKEKPENDTFDHISIFLNNELVCYIQTEDYHSIGGPDPYHDTYNFAFFMTQYQQDEILKGVKAICQQNDYKIRAIEIGLEAPKQTFWYRLKNLF